MGRMPVWMGAAITIGPFYALYNDSDLTTTLATHALGPAILLLFFYGHTPSEKIRALGRRLARGRLPQAS